MPNLVIIGQIIRAWWSSARKKYHLASCL